MPRVLAVQLLFLHRYLFVLVDEGVRMNRARALRASGTKGLGMRVHSHMLGTLLLRALDRAQRIHLAMRCRGFDGQIRTVRPASAGVRDLIFVLGWSTLFIVMRMHNIPHLLGGLVTGAGG